MYFNSRSLSLAAVICVGWSLSASAKPIQIYDAETGNWVDLAVASAKPEVTTEVEQLMPSSTTSPETTTPSTTAMTPPFFAHPTVKRKIFQTIKIYDRSLGRWIEYSPPSSPVESGQERIIPIQLDNGSTIMPTQTQTQMTSSTPAPIINSGGDSFRRTTTVEKFKCSRSPISGVICQKIPDSQVSV
ncbi:uncharacterized protein LOC129739296 [Uranotaenia lowii]|uniref:uncharacterized protein LOC129739296 n=1 Tax=Uranotaenia lowii TaxID=190385 RepID=UPI00247A2354|nr:uncharacterized protein LOC129739296 [Uranotaenia lowii]